MQRHIGSFLRQRVDKLHKALQSAGRAACQHFLFEQLAAGLPQRQLTIARGLAHHIQGTIADAAGRRIDHALKRRVIVAVGNQTQIRERIFDFLTFEEAHAAVDTVRHAGL